MKASIRIDTENFRAIKRANILIDGITLVAGENGCGKSTLSKLIYFLYKTVSNYEFIVKAKLYGQLEDVLRLLEIFQQEIVFRSADRKLTEDFRKELVELRRGFRRSDYIKDELDNWISLIEKVQYLYGKYGTDKNGHPPISRSFRLRSIIKNILQDELGGDYDNVSDDKLPFESIKTFVTNKFKEAQGKIDSRPTSLFMDELKKVFSDSKPPKRFEIFEFEEMIVSSSSSHLSIPFSVQNVVYIDTPMMISVEDSHNSHWEDLNELLLLSKVGYQNRISSIIGSEVIGGDVKIDEGIYSTEEFKFTRADGNEFNLLEVATGIKSFAILQLLLKTGKIDSKTLLIIDEPESNLHPQWIIEYARIIVYMNKSLGVKFFLASHNPDMVSAIRYISEKEGILDGVNFYLAEKSDSRHQYDFNHLGHNIEPIFSSFNIAIDRINKYGI